VPPNFITTVDTHGRVWPVPVDARLAARERSLRRPAAGFVVAIGGLALLGWALDVGILRSLLPGVPDMKPNSAIALVLAGGALLSLPDEGRGGGAFWALTGGVVAIGTLTLLEYVLGVDLGIDGLIWSGGSGPHPARPAVNTSICLVLIGVALALHGAGGAVRARDQAPILVALAIAFLALIGYGLEEGDLSTIAGYQQMALHTAVCLLVLGGGMLVARPDQGLMARVNGPSAGSRSVRRLLPIAIGAPTLLGVLRYEGHQAGWWSIELGVWLYTVLLIGVLVGVVLLYGRRVDDEDDRFRGQERRGREVLAASPDAFVAVNPAGRITDWNTEAARTLGWTREEAIGRGLTDTLIPERFHAEHRRGFATFVETGTGPILHQRIELVARRRDGSELPVEVTIAPLPGGGAFAFLHDISERRTADAEIEARTRELERSNAELEQFAYVASHDLAEPLRAISGFAELLESGYRGRLDTEADEFLAFITDGTRRMRAMIDGLLAFSRSGRGELQRVAVDCDRVVDETVAALGALVADRGARVTRDDLPTVRADRAQLAQVFQNLIANALKFHADGATPHVHIGADRLDGAWRLWVRDDGIGLDPAHRGKIFRMFGRLHSRGEYPGTGIGLAICDRIVARHGGTMDLESSPGEGSIFSFTLAD
jgi:PAS domain S-box-containing protein